MKTINMSGSVGKPVTFQCPYSAHHHNDTMFVCKGDRASNCTDIMDQSRFILNNVAPNSYSVTITKLKPGDAGSYWCTVDPEASVGNYTHFHLSVGEIDTGTQVYKLPQLPLISLILCGGLKMF